MKRIGWIRVTLGLGLTLLARPMPVTATEEAAPSRCWAWVRRMTRLSKLAVITPVAASRSTRSPARR